MTGNQPINDLDERAKNLIINVFNNDEILNMDTLFDSIQSIYFEVKNSKLKAPGYELFSTKFEKYVENITASRINSNDFEKLKLLGQGGFGKVYLVRNKHSKNVYAMKIMNKSLLLRSNQSAFFWEERKIMALLDCPWIVKLFYAFIDSDDLYMIMEFIQGGDLINLMSCYDIPLEWAKFYAAEAAIALNALHEFGFIHLDIKPDNMLLDNNGHIKLCDFGTCVNVKETGKFLCNFAVGTPDYISPEMLSSHNHVVEITKATDWWSWAALFYELLFEEPPFSSDSLVGTYAKIANYESSLKFPRKDTELTLACDLISRVFVDYNDRIGFKEIKEDQFFKNSSWSFDNIRSYLPPFIPDIKGDDDISNFDISDSPETTNVSKSSKFAGVAGDQLNFIGFSFNPTLYGNEVDVGSPLNNRNLKVISDSQNGECLELELSKMKENMVDLQQTLSGLENDNKKLSNNKLEMVVLLKTTRFQLENSKQTNKTLKEKIEEHVKRECITEKEIKEYTEKINKYNTEIDRLHDICRHLENEKANIEFVNSNNAFESMTLKKTYGSVEKQMAVLKKKYQQLEKEMDKVVSQLEFEKQRNEQFIALQNNTENFSGRPSVSSELNVPAIKNRSILVQNNDVDPEYIKKIQSEQKYLESEVQNLKNIIHQNSENECNMKNDIRILTNENKQIKEKLDHSLIDIRSNEEFIEIERKAKSHESYVNLYKKQVKELTNRTEALTKKCSNLKIELDLEIQKRKEYQKELEKYKNNYINELNTSKQLKHEMEVIDTNNNFEVSKSKTEKDKIQKQFDIIQNNLLDSENQVSILNTKLKDIESELTNEKNKLLQQDESQQEKRWKQLYNLEKLKKDQTIKKLDEMVQLMASKGLITSHSTSHNSNISESKMIKKLQMELRNEKIKFEKLLSEKQSIIIDNNQNTQRLEHKIQILKDERDQLNIFANSTKLKNYKCDSSLTVSSNRLTSSRKSYPSSLNLNQELSAPDDKSGNVNQSKSIINPITQPLPKTQSNIHFEGTVSLIPFTKIKRVHRKVVWKKYYAVLSLNELLIFSDKNDKTNPMKAFQKIETRCLKSVSKTSHRDLAKADSKDLPRVFMIRYFDQDIANITEVVKEINCRSANISLILDPNDNSIKKFKGHSLIISKVDNQPFCGACSSNLAENRQGGKLIYCYECKKCALKFHAFHINTNDSSVSYCSHDSPSTDDGSDMENSNFFMNMFLMAPSVEEQFKWIYNLNRIIKMSRSIFHCKNNSNSDHDSPGSFALNRERSPAKLKKKVTVRYLESVLSKSKSISNQNI